MRITTVIILASALSFISCNNEKNNFDASGAFESVETIISTESSGTIMEFNVEEGQTLNVGQQVGYVDTVQLFLRKQQLEAQIAALLGQKPDVPLQIASLEAQLKQAESDQRRITNLIKENATTQKELDNINTQVEVLKKQIIALKSSLDISSSTLTRSVAPLERQIAQLDDQIKKCRIINPVHGTVLIKYSQNHEVVNPGKALYKIAGTDTLTLRAYITGSQLTQVKLGQNIKVRTDEGKDKYREYKGTIYWISDKSEFTPKTIPTKDERADLVYAIKVRVANDGFLKIGMYAEVKF